MATLSGTQVIAKVVPVDSLDTYPTHDEQYGFGGFRTVADTTARDAIPAARRKQGMMVQVLANGHFYILDADLTSWTDKGTLSGGGGGTGYTADNTVYVDSAATPVTGIVFNDFATADTYVQTQTPAIGNTWCIKFAAGTYTDAIVSRPFVTIKGESGSTVLTGAITGGIAFAEIAALFTSNIEDCVITNLVGTTPKIFYIKNCTITGGTMAGGITFCQYCTINGTLDASLAIAFVVQNSYIGGGTFGSSSSFSGCSLNGNLGASVSFIGGSFNNCSIETATITDASTYNFYNCFFSQTAVVLTTYTSAIFNFINCVANNQLDFTLNGGTLNTFVDNTNIRIIDQAQTLKNNILNQYKVSQYTIRIPYTDLSINNTTNVITVKNFPAKTRINGIILYPSIQFAGGTVSALVASLGTTGQLTRWYSSVNIFTAPSNTNFYEVNTPVTLTLNNTEDVILTITSTGDTLNNLTNGEIMIVIQYQVLT